MAAEFDDVPPLEDMTELLRQSEALRGTLLSNSAPTKSLPHQSGIQNGSVEQGQSKTSQEDVRTKSAPPKKEGGNFGGFKKGFLFGSSSKPKQAKPVEKAKVSSETKGGGDIPLIKPTDPKSKEEQLTMPEVQQAMDANQAFLQNKEWVSDDVLQKVTSNPTLSKKLMDPTFMQAITEFQTNPAAAMAKYQNNTEMQDFLKEFCGLMGYHFTKMGEQQIAQPGVGAAPPVVAASSPEGADISVHSSTNPKQATAQDERKMQEILANPEIRDILQDPRIQRLFEVLRTDSEKAQRAMQAADGDMKQMIGRLCDVGLLQIQR